jgi:D-alanine-D-alanine ligase
MKRIIKKNWQEMRVAVLMGGISSEREISLKTGSAVEKALKNQGIEVIAIDVGYSLFERLSTEKIDVAFLALHGKYGEDGAIQGLLETLHIPYTGSNVLASALAFHKGKAKSLFSFHHIPTAPFITLEKKNFLSHPDRVGELAWGYPIVIKPCEEGSTIGISLVKGPADLESACVKAFRYAEDILMEEFIDGREVTVGILGNQALPVVEVIPLSGFYDYESKYTAGKTEYLVPARLGDELYQRVQGLGLQAHQVLGCRGVSRVDFRVDREGNPFVLEVNTTPGMTETSLLPKAAREAGISFEELVKRILILTLEDGGANSQ